jgi:probable rRNA maturation factor
LIDVEVEDAAWTDALPAVVMLARGAALAALASHEAADEGVTILLADDAAVAELNARFRGKDGPTNVLSFEAAPNPERHLGDLALAYGVCAGEAAEQGKPLSHHLQHMTVHGVLHLLGYDHIGDDAAEVMEDLERAVLAGLGVPDPYAAG